MLLVVEKVTPSSRQAQKFPTLFWPRPKAALQCCCDPSEIVVFDSNRFESAPSRVPHRYRLQQLLRLPLPDKSRPIRMESRYGVGINNRYALFLDQDDVEDEVMLQKAAEAAAATTKKAKETQKVNGVAAAAAPAAKKETKPTPPTQAQAPTKKPEAGKPTKGEGEFRVFPLPSCPHPPQCSWCKAMCSPPPPSCSSPCFRF